MPFAAILTANIALPQPFLAVTGDLFITKATPMHFIDGKGHNHN